MAKELVFTERFKKNFKDLPLNIQERFEEKLEIFLSNPKHPSLQIHRFTGIDGVWEVYVTQKYRFTFSVTKESIMFRNIGGHRIIDRGNV
ncbi:MAG: hypothetical protein HQL26_02440 [Candidatus Omnitrophica bacterium]|nr:hypothetical protein [Candidatus Omnitrophota bacterium]